MSEPAGETPVQTPEFSAKELLGPLLLVGALKGEEFDISVILDIYVSDIITQKILQQVALPEDFKEFEGVIKTMLEMEKLKALSAVLRGERPEIDVGKTLEFVITLSVMSSLLNTLG